MFFSNSQCTPWTGLKCHAQQSQVYNFKTSRHQQHQCSKDNCFQETNQVLTCNIAFVFALGLNNSQHVFCKIKVLVHVVPLCRSRVPGAYVHPSDCHSCCFRFCAVNSWSMMCRVISMEKVSFWTVPGLFHWYFVNLNLANSSGYNKTDQPVLHYITVLSINNNGIFDRYSSVLYE